MEIKQHTFEWLKFSKEILHFLDLNENTTYQNIWNIPMHAYIRKSDRSQINNLMMYLKLWEKHEQAKPKLSR
jgi:hypothetical protein